MSSRSFIGLKIPEYKMKLSINSKELEMKNLNLIFSGCLVCVYNLLFTDKINNVILYFHKHFIKTEEFIYLYTMY